MGAHDTDRETTTGKTRWVKNLFFNGGLTKYPRLDEIHNFHNPNVSGVGDFTDEDLAREILLRAGLSSHRRYEDLVEIFADALGTIDNAMRWLNPNYNVGAESHPKAPTGTSTKTVEEMSTPKPEPTKTSTPKTSTAAKKEDVKPSNVKNEGTGTTDSKSK